MLQPGAVSIVEWQPAAGRAHDLSAALEEEDPDAALAGEDAPDAPPIPDPLTMEAEAPNGEEEAPKADPADGVTLVPQPRNDCAAVPMPKNLGAELNESTESNEVWVLSCWDESKDDELYRSDLTVKLSKAKRSKHQNAPLSGCRLLRS